MIAAMLPQSTERWGVLHQLINGVLRSDQIIITPFRVECAFSKRSPSASVSITIWLYTQHQPIHDAILHGVQRFSSEVCGTFALSPNHSWMPRVTILFAVHTETDTNDPFEIRCKALKDKINHAFRMLDAYIEVCVSGRRP